MNAEIINVGSEILIGDILNTHAQFLSQQLTTIGINVLWHTSVGDNKIRLQQSIELALKRSNLIILTGGLGPTQDDLTKEVLAKAISKELIFDSELKSNIVNKFKHKQGLMPENNFKQAQIFKNSIVFENKNGTAPGLAIVDNDKTVILLPGPPRELIPMFVEQVKPWLLKKSNSVIMSKNVHLCGVAESVVDEKIKPFLNLVNPSVGIYAKLGEVRLRITCRAKTLAKCNELIDGVQKRLESKLKPYIYGVDVENLETALVQTAINCKKTIAVAESCTGGLIASKIVSVKNASKCFKFATVCYTNQMKEKILNVSGADLKEFGAVSSQVAQQMANGVRLISNSDIGISTTGIASSGGEQSSQKPVGLVFVGLSTKEKTVAFKLNFQDETKRSRNDIILLASMFAMNVTRKLISGTSNAD